MTTSSKSTDKPTGFSLKAKAKDVLSNWKSWLVPALTIGASMYVKSKQSAKVRWYMGTEDEAKGSAVALLLAKLGSGLTLPAPTAGFHWKPIKMTLATSLFSSSSDIEVNVLEADPLVKFQGAPVPGMQGLYAADVNDAFPPSYQPGGDQVAMLRKDLEQKGLKLVSIDPLRPGYGDFVVTDDCRVHRIVGPEPGVRCIGFTLKEIMPEAGIISQWDMYKGSKPFKCAFGVRRA